MVLDSGNDCCSAKQLPQHRSGGKATTLQLCDCCGGYKKQRKMKFGKRLQAQKEEHPSWVYMDYSGLKKQLKRMEKFGRNTTLLSKQAFSERDAFVDLLFNDINNIDSFYLLLENQFSTTFSRLLSEVRLLVKHS